jgi:Fur family ferric uptake transcriptional regulator
VTAKNHNRRTDAQEVYTDYLKRNRMFMTKERVSLLDYILAQEGHFSADELLFGLQKDDVKVSRATLYRTLSQMVEAGILSESDFGHGHTHYEITLGEDPHAHLIGSKMDEVREVTSPELEKALEALCRKEGFEVKRYKIQIFGEFLTTPKRRK